MDKEIPLNEPIIVMDAGGTNFRVAVVYFDKDKKTVIEDYNIYPMPGKKSEISKEEFYTTIARYIEPVLNRSKKIGFCFSFPTEILSNKDGRLLQFSKEVRVRDLIGEVIGKNILATLKTIGLDGDKEIVLLNDTVATLLGGKASYPDRVFSSYYECYCKELLVSALQFSLLVLFVSSLVIYFLNIRCVKKDKHRAFRLIKNKINNPGI